MIHAGHVAGSNLEPSLRSEPVRPLVVVAVLVLTGAARLSRLPASNYFALRWPVRKDLNYFLQEFLAAIDLLKRRAARDYSPDQHLQTLPEYRKAKPVARGAVKTCFDLFEAYVKAVKPVIRRQF